MPRYEPPKTIDHDPTNPPLHGGGRDQLASGTILENRYEVLRLCGRGGMSSVYAARDLRFSHVERLCAVKEMVDRARDHETRIVRLANFEREASLLATLSHPAIPKIYDYFSDSGLIYLVLEFIEGEDLERVIHRSDEPIAEETLIEWALQMLDVLSYLHEHQPEPIVFRDMKPSNVMLRPDGSITMIDFGIARTFQPLQRGTMIGTEGYAPPEQYRGIAEPRGDIYALGATLHHLATKSDPRLEAPFTFGQRPPRELNPSLSESFEQIILKAVSYAAADRFPSAAAMAQALIELRDRPQALAGSFAARTTGAAPVRMPSASAPEPGAAPARTVQPAAPEEPVAERILWSIQTGDEVRGAVAVMGDTAYVGSYDQHLYAVKAQDGGIIWRFRSHRGIVSRPLPFGNMIVVGSEDHSVYALTGATGRVVWSFRTAMPIRSSASRFEDAVVIGSDDGYCYCLDGAQGNLLWRQRTWGPVRSTPLVAGNRVYVGSDDGSVYAFSAVDGHQQWRRPLGQPVLSSAALAYDTIVVGCTNGSIFGLDPQNGAQRWVHTTTGPIIASPRVIDDLAIVGSADGRVYGIGVHDGDVRWESQIANQITGTICIDGARGIVGTIDGNVFCLSLDSGETIWSHRLESPIVSTPAVCGAVVVVGALNGKIYGLRA